MYGSDINSDGDEDLAEIIKQVDYNTDYSCPIVISLSIEIAGLDYFSRAYPAKKGSTPQFISLSRGILVVFFYSYSASPLERI